MPPPTNKEPEHVNPEELYQVICAATSQDPAQTKASSDRLKQIFEMVGVFDTLSQIAAQSNLPVHVRQQAIIQLKNSSLGHWKSRKLSTEEHKRNIKRRCLELLHEPDDVIAECNEVILAKIARLEYPTSWPNVLEDIMNLVNAGMQAWYSDAATPQVLVTLRRALEALNAVLKEFVNMKMLSGIRTCGSVVGNIHMIMQNHYSTAAARLASLDPATVSSPRTAQDLLVAHLIFKCIAKMGSWVYSRLKATDEVAVRLEPWLVDLFRNSAVQLQTLSELRINLVLAIRAGAAPATQVTTQSIETLMRHVRLFGRFFRRLQQLDAAKFVKLPSCSDLVLYYWSKVVQATNSPSDQVADDPTAVFPVRFLVQAMVLFKESLAQWTPMRKDGSSSEQVLSQTFVEDAVKLLVTRFIPLDPSDLEEWMSDPEEWVNLEEKDNEQWEYELRPCGERVLMTLANQYRPYVVPLLRATFQQLVALPTEDLPSILQKEALYCAIGRCATKLKDEIPWDTWLTQSLLPEAQSTNTSYPIIKRRIAWLIGKWISSQCATPNNPHVWEVLIHLLRDRGQGTDAVVRLTAAVALKECVDTLEFDVEVFLPFLHTSIVELLRLLDEADSIESKRRILTTLNVVIERAGAHIVPLLPVVAQPLPQLWTSAEEEWLLKGSLLETLTKLIESSKEQSNTLIGLVVPLVRESFGPVAQVQLDEDALILWQASLRNTNTLESPDGSASLFELAPLVMRLLAENYDLLGKITTIVESYLLLDAPRLLQACASELFAALLAGMKHALQINVKDMAQITALACQHAPSSLWGGPLHTTGLFAYLAQSLQEDKLAVELLTEFVLVMARIALMDKHMFAQLVSASVPALNLSETEIWDGILNEWWRRFDNMSEPRHRKLAAMGMASLVSTGRHEVLERLHSEVCNLWLDVLCEIREAQVAKEEGGPEVLYLYWDSPPSSFYRDTEGTPEYARREASYQNDPARTTQLTTYIRACLAEAEAAIGGPAVLQERYLAKADPTVLAQIQAELTGQKIQHH